MQFSPLVYETQQINYLISQVCSCFLSSTTGCRCRTLRIFKSRTKPRGLQIPFLFQLSSKMVGANMYCCVLKSRLNLWPSSLDFTASRYRVAFYNVSILHGPEQGVIVADVAHLMSGEAHECETADVPGAHSRISRLA